MEENNGQTTNELGGILREIREEQHLGRQWVAEHADIGPRHLIAIELGEKNPSVDTLRRLIRCFGVSADRVFYPEGYVRDDQLEEIGRLAAICTPKQRQLAAAFIKMLLDQPDLNL